MEEWEWDDDIYYEYGLEEDYDMSDPYDMEYDVP